MITALWMALAGVEIYRGMGHSISTMMWAWCLIMYGLIQMSKDTLEMGIYAAVVMMWAWLMEATDWNKAGDLWVGALAVHILAAALVGVGIWRERGRELPVRMMTGGIILSVVMGGIALASGSSTAHSSEEGFMWQMMFLVEEVVMVGVGGAGGEAEMAVDDRGGRDEFGGFMVHAGNCVRVVYLHGVGADRGSDLEDFEEIGVKIAILPCFHCIFYRKGIDKR